MTEVPPSYNKIHGMIEKAGNIILNFHSKFKTSSKKPSKIVKMQDDVTAI
jgi:hypothetical protein